MNAFPVDLEAVAEYVGVELEYAELDSLAGAYYPKERLIVVSTMLSNEQRKRFTIAHELGHATIPGHANVSGKLKGTKSGQ